MIIGADSGAERIAMLYKAFISYSHVADAQLAPALQSALRRVGSPWYRRAQFRVFLDNSSLSANPALWNAIESALGQSEYLLLLASTSSAQSEWVKRELDWWLSHREPATILILVTDGLVVWRPGDRDFDWEQTTALSGRLRGQFPDEPLWVDLRWARSERKFSLRHTRFRSAVLQIAPPLYGKSREDLDDEDTRHYRSAGGRTSALAHRCFLPEHRRNVLLPVQHPGRLQPVHRELEHPGVDDRGGYRDHPARGEGAVPGSSAPDHLGQRAAVHCQGLQGVHSDLRHDSRPHLAVLPAIEREDRALAQIAQRGVHPARNAVVAR